MFIDDCMPIDPKALLAKGRAGSEILALVDGSLQPTPFLETFWFRHRGSEKEYLVTEVYGSGSVAFLIAMLAVMVLGASNVLPSVVAKGTTSTDSVEASIVPVFVVCAVLFVGCAFAEAFRLRAVWRHGSVARDERETLGRRRLQRRMARLSTAVASTIATNGEERSTRDADASSDGAAFDRLFRNAIIGEVIAAVFLVAFGIGFMMRIPADHGDVCRNPSQVFGAGRTPALKALAHTFFCDRALTTSFDFALAAVVPLRRPTHAVLLGVSLVLIVAYAILRVTIVFPARVPVSASQQHPLAAATTAVSFAGLLAVRFFLERADRRLFAGRKREAAKVAVLQHEHAALQGFAELIVPRFVCQRIISSAPAANTFQTSPHAKYIPLCAGSVAARRLITSGAAAGGLRAGRVDAGHATALLGIQLYDFAAFCNANMPHHVAQSTGTVLNSIMRILGTDFDDAPTPTATGTDADALRALVTSRAPQHVSQEGDTLIAVYGLDPEALATDTITRASSHTQRDLFLSAMALAAARSLGDLAALDSANRAEDHRSAMRARLHTAAVVPDRAGPLHAASATAGAAVGRVNGLLPAPNTGSPRLAFALHCGAVVGEIPALSPSTWRYWVCGRGVSEVRAMLQHAVRQARVLVSQPAVAALGPAAEADLSSEITIFPTVDCCMGRYRDEQRAAPLDDHPLTAFRNVLLDLDADLTAMLGSSSSDTMSSFLLQSEVESGERVSAASQSATAVPGTGSQAAAAASTALKSTFAEQLAVSERLLTDIGAAVERELVIVKGHICREPITDRDDGVGASAEGGALALGDALKVNVLAKGASSTATVTPLVLHGEEHTVDKEEHQEQNDEHTRTGGTRRSSSAHLIAFLGGAVVAVRVTLLGAADLVLRPRSFRCPEAEREFRTHHLYVVAGAGPFAVCEVALLAMLTLKMVAAAVDLGFILDDLPLAAYSAVALGLNTTATDVALFGPSGYGDWLPFAARPHIASLALFIATLALGGLTWALRRAGYTAFEAEAAARRQRRECTTTVQPAVPCADVGSRAPSLLRGLGRGEDVVSPARVFWLYTLPRVLLPTLKQGTFLAATFLTQPARSGIDNLHLWTLLAATSLFQGWPTAPRWAPFLLYDIFSIIFIALQITFPFSFLRRPFFILGPVIMLLAPLLIFAVEDRERKTYISRRLQEAFAVALQRQAAAREALVSAAIPAPMQRLLADLKSLQAAASPPIQPIAGAAATHLAPALMSRAWASAVALAGHRAANAHGSNDDAEYSGTDGTAGSPPPLLASAVGTAVVVRLRLDRFTAKTESENDKVPAPLQTLSAYDVTLLEALDESAALAALVQAVDRALSGDLEDTTGQEPRPLAALSLMEVAGREVVVGGPWVQRGNMRTAVEGAARDAFAMVTMLAEHLPRAGLTCSIVVTADDAIVCLRNASYPAFDLFGTAPLRASALLRAAPAGTVAFTESFATLLAVVGGDVIGRRNEGPGGDASCISTQQSLLLRMPARWAVRGLPRTSIFTLPPSPEQTLFRPCAAATNAETRATTRIKTYFDNAKQ